MREQAKLDLVVTEVRQETPLIRTIRLAGPQDEPLPSWQAGAHIKVQIPQSGERSYSLVNLSIDPSANRNPRSYLLGVRLEQPSQGGSAYMHSLEPGQAIAASVPSNNFPLQDTDRPVVLLAGGIGVTPLVSMAAELAVRDHPFRLYYAGRSRDQLAMLTAIEALAGSRLSIHTDDASGLFDVAGLMRSLQHDEPLYCCGPMPMI